jgi:2',3'-cyclic-nucleotide 2'-phosphodiesterase (5'-nucleotidase family)
VQAGEFGDHVGRVAVDGKTTSAGVIAVSAELEPHPSVETEARRIEREVVELLSEPISVLDERLDAAWVAQMLRARMHADVGLFAEGLVVGTLPPGQLTRGALWEFSPTGNNPGVAEMTGRQLRDLLRRAENPVVVADTPRPLRGRRRGRLFVAGLNPEQIDDERLYTVAATDWVLDSYGGYTKKEWALQVRYDFPVTIREAIEAALHDQGKGICHS